MVTMAGLTQQPVPMWSEAASLETEQSEPPGTVTSPTAWEQWGGSGGGELGAHVCVEQEALSGWGQG